MRKRLFCLLLAATVCASVAWAADGRAERTKTFADLDCELTLPGAEYQWIEPATLPGSFASFGKPGVTVLFMATATPPGFVLDERGFDEGMTQSGAVVKNGGKTIRFRDAPCYELRLRFVANSLPAVMRCITAHGRLYQIQVVGLGASDEEVAAAEPLFAAFEFTAPPAQGVAAPVRSAPSGKPTERSVMHNTLEFSQMMGRIVGLCLLAIAVVLIVRHVKKSKSSN